MDGQVGISTCSALISTSAGAGKMDVKGEFCSLQDLWEWKEGNGKDAVPVGTPREHQAHEDIPTYGLCEEVHQIYSMVLLWPLC